MGGPHYTPLLNHTQRTEAARLENPSSYSDAAELHVKDEDDKPEVCTTYHELNSTLERGEISG